MGKGKKRRNKGGSSSYRPQIKIETGEIKYLATVFIEGTFITSDASLDKIDGDTVAKKMDIAIRDSIKSKIPGSRAVMNIRFKPKDPKDEHFLAEYSTRLAERQMREEENNHAYIGAIIGKDKKKLALFTYPEIKEAWRQQREVWESWKEFIRVFLDDLVDSDEMDLETDDIPESYSLPEEKIIKSKLLRDFTDDFEKLGFKKKEKEPQT